MVEKLCVCFFWLTKATEICCWEMTWKQVSMLTKRVQTGVTMGGIATLWIFSGNWVFSVGFAMQALLAQLEYYRMAMQKGEMNGTWNCREYPPSPLPPPPSLCFLG